MSLTTAERTNKNSREMDEKRSFRTAAVVIVGNLEVAETISSARVVVNNKC